MNINFVAAKCFTPGRFFQHVDTIVIHWMDGTLTDADQVFTSGSRKSSAHFGVQDDQVHQYVKIEDTAWHAGNWLVNLRSVGVENSAQPGRLASDTTYETSSQLIAKIWKQLGITPSRSSLKKHSEIVATQCPGTIDVDRLYARALEIFKGTVTVPVQGDFNVSPSIPGTLASAPLSPTSPHFNFQYNLTPGMVGPEVAKLQEALLTLGVVNDVAGMKAGIGTYGPRTSQAVATFQLQHGIIHSGSEYGAGYFGPHTRSVINNL